MKSVFLLGMPALLLLAAGTVVHFLYGYKDSLWIQGTAYLSIIFGWLCILFMLVLLHPPKPSAEQAGNKIWQQIKHRLYFASYLIWLVSLVASLVLIEIMKDKRVDAVLSRPDAIYTTATVTGIEQRYVRHSTHTYAIIAYPTTTGRVQQAIQDDAGFYKQGQQVRLLYSPEYPNMFRVAASLSLPATDKQ